MTHWELFLMSIDANYAEYRRAFPLSSWLPEPLEPGSEYFGPGNEEDDSDA